MQTLGKRRWAIAEGYIPPDDVSKPRQFISHETACLLNTNAADARVEITLFFAIVSPSALTVLWSRRAARCIAVQ